MSEFKASGFRDEFGSSGPDIVGLTTFTSPYYFVPPSGSTAERPSSPPPGMLRFNTDIGRLEVWRNDHWATILGESPNLGDHNNTNSSAGTGTRGLFASKLSPANSNVIQYVSISTLGNTQDFGDLTEPTADVAGMSSRTRGIFAGGYGNHGNDMCYVTFASTGDAIDFGNLSSDRRIGDARASSSTRGVMMGHMTFSPFGGGNNSIEYITIPTLGDAIDFGDLSDSNALGAGFSSSVRACVAGGGTPTNINTIRYITISTTGNSQDFGDLSTNKRELAGLSNSTRGLICGGYDGGASENTIEFVTISTTGNAQDFGDQTAAFSAHSGTSSSTRGILGAIGSPAGVIDFIEIATTGNAQDFGDFSFVSGGGRNGSCSNGHGGL